MTVNPFDKLTPTAARDLQPTHVPPLLRDHEVGGLELHAGIRVKTWRLYYRNSAGIERRPRLGAFPEISLSAARDVAKEWKIRIAKGEDPSADRKAARAAPMVSELCDKFLTDYAPHHKDARSAHEDKLLIETHVKPGLGRHRVASVTTAMVDAFLSDVRRRRFAFAKMRKQVEAGRLKATWFDREQARRSTAPGAANHCRALLSKLFNLAETDSFGKMRPQHTNPVRHAARNTMLKRKRAAAPDEIVRIATALDALEADFPAHVACLWCLFLTGGRVGEILEAKSTELVGNKLIKADHKTVDHIGEKTIYVPKPAMRILERLPIEPSKDGRLFGKIALKKIWNRVRKDAGLPGLQLRDARRTFASYAVDEGKTLAQIGEMLGHLRQETTKGYSYLFEGAKEQATEQVAEHIWRVATGGRATPVAKRYRLRRGAFRFETR
jgi:integrase